MSVDCSFVRDKCEGSFRANWCLLGEEKLCIGDNCIILEINERGKRIETLLTELKEAKELYHPGTGNGNTSCSGYGFTFDTEAQRWRPTAHAEPTCQKAGTKCNCQEIKKEK